MKTPQKYSIIFAVFAAFCVLTIYISSASPKIDPNFSYKSGSPSSSYVQVMPDWPVDVPFSFNIDPGTTEVVLELVDAETLYASGIELKSNTVSVANGIASSKALFDMKKDNSMRPGTYSMKIIAKDKNTGEVVKTGKIPFIVNMEQIIARCSC